MENMEEYIEKMREDAIVKIKENIRIIMEREYKYDSPGRKVDMC